MRSHARLLAVVVSAAAFALPVSIAGRAQKQAAPPQKPAQTQAQGQARTITLPPDTIEYQKSDLPGYALTAERCSLCHAADYVAYQPRTSSRAYWQATVDKMVKVFGAPLAPEQIPPIVDYLTKTYGAEAPKAD